MTNEKACIASKNMSLDILRIIAALMVLMVHVGQCVFCKYKLPKNAEALPKSCSGKFLKVA